jgi:hypothetical protein
MEVGESKQEGWVQGRESIAMRRIAHTAGGDDRAVLAKRELGRQLAEICATTDRGVLFVAVLLSDHMLGLIATPS